MASAKKVLATIASIVILTTGILAVFFYFTYLAPSSRKRTIVEIHKGQGVKGIGLRLEHSGVIKNNELFVFYVIAKRAQNKLKAGEYEFQPGESMAHIIEKLVTGEVFVRKITIPEGLTIDQIGGLLDINGVISKEEFLKKAKSIKFARELLGESISSFEGYLFPDTYSYTKGIISEEFIRVMVSRFKKVYGSLKTQYREVNLTDREVVTLASIIEKETGSAYERPLISAVFHNRLRLAMRLESDSTVIYGLGGDFDGDLTKENLRTEATYNTYRSMGLPPGPISNPGKDSLESALNPAKVNYLYFVSKGDGTHYFSSDYRDHREAVFKYQKQSGATEKKH
jgi:UPF0755 protein